MAKITQRIGLPRYEADEHYKMALTAYQKGDYDLAVDGMNKAIALLPTEPEYLAARGFVYLQDGIIEKAEADFKAALQKFSFEMLAHYGLGMIAYKAKQWPEALNHFNTAYAAQPKRPEILYYLALTQHRLRNNIAALNYMQQAQQIFEENNDRSHRADANKWLKVFEDLLSRDG